MSVLFNPLNQSPSRNSILLRAFTFYHICNHFIFVVQYVHQEFNIIIKIKNYSYEKNRKSYSFLWQYRRGYC